MNGANTNSDGPDNSGLQITTNSYDYDAPITEYGNYTEKYYAIRDLILSHQIIDIKHPEIPGILPTVAYPELPPESQILFSDIIDSSNNRIDSKDILPMEKLSINDNSGQSYGYIVYRKTNVDLNSSATLKVSGYIRDTILVLINGKLVSKIPEKPSDIDGFGFWRMRDSTITIYNPENTNVTIDLIIENFGRNNYGEQQKMMFQFKGLTDDVYLNEEKLVDWQIIPFEFKKSWVNQLNDWKSEISSSGPAVYRFRLVLEGDPKDTFLDMREWTKGIVIVNGFVLGRYFFLGPQQTMYLPAAFLNKGENNILVFEHYKAADSLRFVDKPIFETPALL